MKNIFVLFYNLVENYFHLQRIKIFLSQKVLLKKPIIFDVGAHNGKLTRLFNNLYEKAKIYCFEPNKKMNSNLKKIGKNIKVYNLAVGSKIEKKKLIINKIDLTNTLSKINKNSFYLKIKNLIIGRSKKKNSFEKVRVVSLKNFCKTNKIRSIDFLKIDVEGYEYDVLRGAKGLLKNINFIMIEIQKNDMYRNYSQKKIEKFLIKNNFKLIKSFNFPFMFFKDCIYKRIKN